MDLEKTPIITFRTDDSGLLKGVSSVKELKIAIQQLRDEEVKLRQAGEDTTKTTTQLQAAQRELNAVMGLTKQGADGVEGSYNNLVAKLREAKTEWKALPKFINGELNPAWDAARQKVEQYNTELKSMDASVGVFNRNVGNYKSALDGFTGTMGEAARIGGDFRNGISAMSGIMAIAGADTSEMNDAMKNLQITVGVLQGVKGLGGLIKQIGSYFKVSAQAVTVTKADTTAKNADTVATTTMAGAETAAAGATTLLGTALKALGIGLIVAALAFVVDHLQDIVKWVTDLGVKLGIVKEKNKDQLSLVEKTKKKYDEEKDTLDKQAKIMAAQGKSQKDILKFQIQEITASIKTKEAELASAQATVKRLEAHNWIQRVLKGEQGEYKQMKKVVDELTAEIKEQQKTLADTKFDLELEGYREETENRKKAQTAAEKAKAEADRKAAEALKLAQEIVKKGTAEAIKAIQKEETELEKLNREYKEQKKLIEDAQKVLKANTGLTGDQKLLEEGLVVIRSNYYKKQFELKAAENSKKVLESKEKEYKAAEEAEKVYKRVFNQQSQLYDVQIRIGAAEQRKLDTLKAELAYYRKNVELTDEVLATLTGKSYDELIEDGFVEPLASAIRLYFEKSDEIKEAGYDIYENMFASFEERFKAQVESGRFDIARLFADNFFNRVIEEFDSLGYAHEFTNYLKKFTNDAYEEAFANSEYPVSAQKYFFDYDEIEDLKKSLKSLAVEYAAVYEEYKKVDQALYSDEDNELLWKKWDDLALRLQEIRSQMVATEDEIMIQRAKKWKDFFNKMSKYTETYAASTATLLGNVASAWEALLQLQVKRGKKSEEEAKKSFEVVKGLQYAEAIINTAGAITKALATSSNWYEAVINAAAAAAMGTAQVLKIAATDFSGGGTSTVNATAPSITQSQPMVNTYGINPNDYAEAAAQNPIRVYVLEEDITNAQQAVRTRVAEATF